MTAIVLLVLGLLFATLQYPAQMRRFWKWAAITVASAALIAVAIVSWSVHDLQYKSKGASVSNPFDAKTMTLTPVDHDPFAGSEKPE